MFKVFSHWSPNLFEVTSGLFVLFSRAVGIDWQRPTLPSPHILPDQLTLFQQGWGTDYAHYTITCPPRIFRPSYGTAFEVAIFLKKSNSWSSSGIKFMKKVFGPILFFLSLSSSEIISYGMRSLMEAFSNVCITLSERKWHFIFCHKWQRFV